MFPCPVIASSAVAKAIVRRFLSHCGAPYLLTRKAYLCVRDLAFERNSVFSSSVCSICCSVSQNSVSDSRISDSSVSHSKISSDSLHGQ